MATALTLLVLPSLYPIIDRLFRRRSDRTMLCSRREPLTVAAE